MLGAVFFLGTAGSGKTSLVDAYYNFLNERSISCSTVNLDPAVVTLPYNPDVDIRNFVDVSKLLRDRTLGPNGAIVAAMDILATNLGSFLDELASLSSDYLLVDTPGQLELFAFRDIGPILVDRIEAPQKAFIFFLDPIILQSDTGAASLLLLSASVSLRLRIPSLNIISKADMVEHGILEDLVERFENPEGFQTKGGHRNLSDYMALRLVETVFEVSAPSVPLPVSVFDETTIANLHAEIQRLFLGGSSEDVGQAENSEDN